MNALIHKRFDSPAAMASYAHVLARAADAIPVGSGGLPILKLEQDGKDAGFFSFGEEATPVSDDDLWAVNPLFVQRGYICFSQKNEVLGEVLRSITAEPVDFDKLPVHYGRDKRGKEIELEWQPQIVLHMQCIAGPNEGASVVYKPTSGGGLKLCKTILHAIAKQLAKGADKPVPTGYLSAEDYKHKGFNKTIWNPLFDFDKWVDMEFADPEGATSIDDDPAEEPRGRGKAEPEKVDSMSALRAREGYKDEDAPRSRRSRDAEEAEVVEDEPKRGRGRPRKEDAEEDAPRGRGRPAAEEDDAEDTAPRSRTRGRPAAEDDAEDAPRGRGGRSAPAPRRGAREEVEEGAPRSRSRGRDAEEDDAPRSRGGRQSRR